MDSLRRWAVATVFAGALGVCASPAPAAARKTWVWSAAQLQQISQLTAQVVRDKAGFFTLTAGRFDVTTDISPRFAAETSVFMDAFCNGMSEYLFTTLGADKPPVPRLKSGFTCAAAQDGPIYFPRKPCVVIYAEEASYRKHFDNGSGGVFVHRYDGRGKCLDFSIYAYARTGLQKNFTYFPISTLMHEGTHCLMQAVSGPKTIAPWFNEGFAQLVDSCDAPSLMTGQLKPKGEKKFWRNHMLNYAGDGWHGQGPSLTKLLAISNWNADKMGRETRYRYALAFNFTEFLFSTDTGRLKLKVMLGRLAERKRPLLNERDSWALERDWHTYLQKSMKKRR